MIILVILHTIDIIRPIIITSADLSAAKTFQPLNLKIVASAIKKFLNVVSGRSISLAGDPRDAL